MAKYSYITDKTHNNRKIQVESAKRDGSGKNIENNYAKQNGNYQSLTAGLSNNFDTKQVMVDESAYNFRPTATMGSVELEVGSPCKVKKIVGGSVAFNQLVNLTDTPSTSWGSGAGTYSISNNIISVNVNATAENLSKSVIPLGLQLKGGHKYLCLAPKYEKIDNASMFLYSSTAQFVTFNTITAVTTDGSFGMHFHETGGLEEAITYTLGLQLFDLTQMLGSTIADYIYSLEQANAGSGIAWFKRYFHKEYYAYNSGELVSVKTQGKKITHFNQWDEQWEWGDIDPETGSKEQSSSRIRNKNPIKVLPDTTYYKKGSTEGTQIFGYDADMNYIGVVMSNAQATTFTTPSNCYYINFRSTSSGLTGYNHDICINFHYDGEMDGEYEPYNSETYPCDDIELRGIPQLDENNNLAFDGDEYASDGNVTRKYGIVDLSTLSFENLGNNVYLATISDLKAPTSNGVTIVGISSKYEVVSYNTLIGDTTSQQICGYVGTNRVYVRDTGGTPSGYLIYELATPTDENSIPFTEVQECDNWGTEEWLAPTTDTRPCEVPVGHETDYLPDLKDKLEVAPTTPNENGVYVMEHSASGNSYTPIATWLADNGYVKPTSISGYDNTKTQTLKNVEGVLTWVDDE